MNDSITTERSPGVSVFVVALAIGIVLCVGCLEGALHAGEIQPPIRRVSYLGPEGDLDYRPASLRPAIAYSTAEEEYLVAWIGDDDATGDDIFHVFARRVTREGNVVGPQMRISSQPVLAEIPPTVSFNPINGKFYVGWTASSAGSCTRLRYATQDPLNGISAAVELACDDLIALKSDFSTSTGEVVFVHYGTHTFGPNDSLGPTLTRVNSDSYPLVFPAGAAFYEDIAVSCSTLRDRCLVVILNNGELTSIETPTTNPSRQSPRAESLMGPDFNDEFDAVNPAVAFDPDRNRYLIVWSGDDDSGGLVDGELEVYGKFRGAANVRGGGSAQFRLTDVGGFGTSSRDGNDPDVVYVPSKKSFLVTYFADDSEAGLSNNEWEIFHQWVGGESEIGPNDVRATFFEGTADPAYDALYPVVATDGSEVLSAFFGRLVWRVSVFDEYDELEIFSSYLDYWLYGDGFEDGDSGRWSSSQ